MRLIEDFVSNGDEYTTLLVDCERDAVQEHLEKDKKLKNIKIISIKKARN